MLPVAGKPLLRWLVDGFKTHGVNDITVVGGYRADAIDVGHQARRQRTPCTDGRTRVARLRGRPSDRRHRDLVRRPAVPQLHRARPRGERGRVQRGGRFVAHETNQSVRDFALCSAADDRGLFGQKTFLQRVSSDVAAGTPHGRWIGLLNVRGAGVDRLKAMLATLQARPDFDTLDIPSLLNELIAAGEDRSAVRARPLARRQRSRGLPPRG